MGNDWFGRNIVILGLARQGSALARYFTRQGARITVAVTGALTVERWLIPKDHSLTTPKQDRSIGAAGFTC